MNNLGAKNRDARLGYDIPRVLSGHTHFATSSGHCSCDEFSEEAIPERDASYLLPEGTDYQGQTVEVMSAESRLDLVRHLQELGMSHSRATMVANLS